jgi:putative ABC transport system substrate-binding protein
MRRRTFITLCGIAALPRAVLSQTRIPLIGVLGGANEVEGLVDGLRSGLAEENFLIGKNVKIEYRYGHGKYDQLPALANELLALPVDLLIAVSSSPTALAAKAATSKIPIVFYVGVDPVGIGLVQSYNRPGGNVTGVVNASELTPKRVSLLHELLPASVPIAELVNQANRSYSDELLASEAAVRALGREFISLKASNEDEIKAAFAIVRDRKAALVVWAEAYFNLERELIVSLAERYSVVTIYGSREFVKIGGLISYGSDRRDMFRYVGVYAGKILHGTSPADLPVMRPTKVALVINLRTAKTLGVAIPPTLLGTADEVIE